MKEKEQLEEDKEQGVAPGENAQLVDASLVAPLPPATNHEEQNFVPAPARGKNLDGTPRKKTFGENLFDWSVYAGIGWFGNEIASGLIHDNTVLPQ
jgi:hypothetical protein